MTEQAMLDKTYHLVLQRFIDTGRAPNYTDHVKNLAGGVVVGDPPRGDRQASRKNLRATSRMARRRGERDSPVSGVIRPPPSIPTTIGLPSTPCRGRRESPTLHPLVSARSFHRSACRDVGIGASSSN